MFVSCLLLAGSQNTHNVFDSMVQYVLNLWQRKICTPLLHHYLGTIIHQDNTHTAPLSPNPVAWIKLLTCNLSSLLACLSESCRNSSVRLRHSLTCYGNRITIVLTTPTNLTGTCNIHAKGSRADTL